METIKTTMLTPAQSLTTPVSASTEADLVILLGVYYVRWSTPGQIKEKQIVGDSVVLEEKRLIQEHIDSCINAIRDYRGFCSKCQRPIRISYVGKGYADKGISGRKIDRESIQNLLLDSENGEFDVVVTPYNSRLGRRRSITATIRDNLKDKNIQIYSVKQPLPLKCKDCFDALDDDAAVINETIADMQSELELSAIRRNYRFGMPSRIQSGKPAGSLCYGLVRKTKIIGTDLRGNDQVEDYYAWDVQKIQIVKRIAREYLEESKGTWGIARDLNIERIPSPQGYQWGRSAILWVLKNPSYAGWVRFGYRPVKGKNRPPQPKEKWLMKEATFGGIYSNDYYEAIQREIARRYNRGRAVSSEALLVGQLKCGFCGYNMFSCKGGKIRKTGSRYEWKGYACGTFMHRGGCRHNGKRRDVVDKAVLHEVLKLANNDTRKTFYDRLQKTKERNIKSELIDKQRLFKSLHKEYDRIKLAFQSGIDSLEEYGKNKERVFPQIQKTQDEIAKLEQQSKQVVSYKWEKIYEIVIQRFLRCDNPEDKRAVKRILNLLIDKIYFKRDPLSVKIMYRAT